MKLMPIDIDEYKNDIFRNDPYCADVLAMYPAYYAMVGYSPPWIGYFATIDGHEMVGCGGFKGRPSSGVVEIAYATFKPFEGKGFAGEICRQLVEIANLTDPAVTISARTLMEENASVKLLKKNGFAFKGVVHDDDDGDVWEWHYIRK